MSEPVENFGANCDDAAAGRAHSRVGQDHAGTLNAGEETTAPHVTQAQISDYIQGQLTKARETLCAEARA